MNEWLSVSELAEFLNVTRHAVQKSIQRGKYKTAIKTEGNGVGQGGLIWKIHILDPAISKRVKFLYYQHRIELIEKQKGELVDREIGLYNQMLSDFYGSYN